jgi:serine/threonine protein kinase
MATKTKASFLKRLTRSQILDDNKIAAAIAVAGEEEKALGEHLVQQGLLTRFQFRQLRAGATNFQVGQYLISDCIGRGGNGVVFKARHRLMRRYVALKTLDTCSLHHANEALARFKREIDIVSRLEHINVVRALDVLETRTHLYLVLELVEGTDLGALVKERGPLPIHEAVNYVLQAARGLQYAHALGIVHRDLKPANLLLTKDGIVKLTDLGLAKLYQTDHEAGLTLKGFCLGTPEYMAPEQAEDAHSAEPRSDLYSLGATLFHLLTGQLPVEGTSYLHRLQYLLTSPPKPLKEARPDVHADLAALVDRMRGRELGQRPASVAEVIPLLEPFAKETPPEDPNTWPAERKMEVVMSLLASQTTAGEVCKQQRIRPEDLERWQQKFVEAGTQALDPQARLSAVERMRELHTKVGCQAMEIEHLRKRLAIALRP